MRAQQIILMNNALQFARWRHTVIDRYMALPQKWKEKYYAKVIRNLGGKYVPCPFGIRIRPRRRIRLRRRTPENYI